jgi:hypothetical protein
MSMKYNPAVSQISPGSMSVICVHDEAAPSAELAHTA